MKTSIFFWNDKNQKCEIWNEEINGKVDYWLKVEGVSQSISEKKYNNLIKKNNLKK
jgi:hypothetical protein